MLSDFVTVLSPSEAECHQLTEPQRCSPQLHVYINAYLIHFNSKALLHTVARLRLCTTKSDIVGTGFDLLARQRAANLSLS